MKIAFVTTELTRLGGGLFDASKHLAKSMLNKTECELKVFGGVSEEYISDVNTWYPVPIIRENFFEKTFAYFPNLIDDIVKWNPDIIHVHGVWQYISLGTYIAKKKTNAKLVVSAHGMLDAWILKQSRFKKYLASLLYQDKQLKYADCLHALCRSEYCSYRKYGLKNPICTIPNGVLVDSLDKLTESYNWPVGVGDKKVLFYLSRIHPKKGLDNLLQAWRTVAASVPGRSWRLVVAGWGEPQYVENIKKKMADSDNAFFIGPLFGNDKMAAYRSAAAFILPSYSEGLPLVVLEAWAQACPVFMTEHCNLPIGFSVGAAQKIDVQDLVTGLSNLVQMAESDMRQMGVNGYELVKNSFTWDSVADQMFNVYSWLLCRANCPSSIV